MFFFFLVSVLQGCMHKFPSNWKVVVIGSLCGKLLHKDVKVSNQSLIQNTLAFSIKPHNGKSKYRPYGNVKDELICYPVLL